MTIDDAPTVQQVKTEKKLFLFALAIFLLIILTALFMRSGFSDTQPSFEHMYAAHEVTGGLCCAVVLLLAFLVLKYKGVWAVSFFESLPLKIAINPFPLLAITLLVLSVSAVVVYLNRPLNVDEYSLYFQARIFAEGKLSGRFPPVIIPWLVADSHAGHFFSVSHQTGRIVTAYWPGFSLLLAPFMKFHVPWLLNPLLTSGSLYLLWLLARRLFSSPSAPGWVILFALASPVVTVSSLSYYAMTSHLFMNLLYAWLLLEISPRRLFLAGIVGSIALVLHNPVPHILFCLPWFVLVANKPNRLKNLTILLLGYLPLSILLGFGWVWVKINITQDTLPLVRAVVDSGNSSEATSAGVDLWSRVGDLIHEPYRLLQSILTVPNLDFLWLRLLGILKIFAWAVPGLPLLALMGGVRLRNDHVGLQLWWWAAILTLAGYMFVPVSQGHGWGFRYFHSVWAALPLLATYFVLHSQWLSVRGRHFVLLSTILSLLFCNGIRLGQAYDFIHRHHAQLPLVEANVGDRMQLVFIDSLQGYYAQDLVQNDPYLRDGTIYLLSRGAALNSQLLQTYFPKATKVRQKGLHTVWLVDKKDWLKLLRS